MMRHYFKRFSSSEATVREFVNHHAVTLTLANTTVWLTLIYHQTDAKGSAAKKISRQAFLEILKVLFHYNYMMSPHYDHDCENIKAIFFYTTIPDAAAPLYQLWLQQVEPQ